MVVGGVRGWYGWVGGWVPLGDGGGGGGGGVWQCLTSDPWLTSFRTSIWDNIKIARGGLMEAIGEGTV